MEWYIPILIYFARICDVSIGTVRTMMLFAGHRYLSAALGAIEVIIWVFAVGGVIEYLTNPLALSGYALGFATGILVGMWIEDRLALGYRMVRLVCPRRECSVAEELRATGYRVTQVEGHGRNGPVEIVFLVIARKHLGRLREDVAKIAPEAFLTVERVDRPSGGEFVETRFMRTLFDRLAPARK